MNNVPDPLLSGQNLPTFKLPVETSREGDRPQVGKNHLSSRCVSKGIAGVSMRIETGAMRETAWGMPGDEWEYVVSGRVRTTVSIRAARRTNDLTGSILVIPRPDTAHAGVPRRRALPVHPDLR